MRIAAELIDATAARHIWGDRFDGTRSDIFALHDRIVATIVGAIEPRLRLAEIARATRKSAETLDAYNLNLRASAQISKRTKQSLKEAVRLLHRALKLDPGYAPAMAQLGYSRLMQTTRHWIAPSGSEVEDGISIARLAIAHARDDPPCSPLAVTRWVFSLVTSKPRSPRSTARSTSIRTTLTPSANGR